MREKNKTNKVMEFLKRYGYIIAVSILLLAFAIVLALTGSSTNNNVTFDEEVSVSATTFYTPVLNFTVAKEYSDTTLQYNTTLKQWEAHLGISFTVGNGADVFAVLDGEIENVYSNYLDGTVVVINHGEGLKTYYYSLSEDVSVSIGDKVTRGTVIGVASNTRNSEANLGNQLYFEVTVDDVKVDPSNYLDLSDK